MNADTLKVIKKVKAPAGTEQVYVRGSLGRGKYLVEFRGKSNGWGVMNISNIKKIPLDGVQPFPQGTIIKKYAGSPGKFVLLV